MNKAFCYITVLLSFMLISCHYFSQEKSLEYAARVNNNYLTKEEVRAAIPKQMNFEDSLIFAQNYIKRWATKQLLLKGANVNLSVEKQEEFNQMVESYRVELYTEAYKDLILSSKMDTTVSDREMRTYFDQKKENFKLPENLVKLRYIKLAKKSIDSTKIKKQFKRFNKKDSIALADEIMKFDVVSLNDSVWVSQQEMEDEIPLLSKKSENYLKKGHFIHFSDSISLYLIFLKDVRLKNEQAPYTYIKSVLKQIILNKRKLEFSKQFEKEITKDALDDNQFEIYD